MAKQFNNPTAFFIGEQPTGGADPAAPQPQETTTETGEGFTVPIGYRVVREPKNRRMQLLITQHVNDRMREAAAAEGISLNELCNRVFEEYLKQRGNT